MDYTMVRYYTVCYSSKSPRFHLIDEDGSTFCERYSSDDIVLDNMNIGVVKESNANLSEMCGMCMIDSHICKWTM